MIFLKFIKSSQILLLNSLYYVLLISYSYFMYICLYSHFYILFTFSGSHKDLLLTYRLEKKDSYSCGENLFYILLKERNMWPFGSHTFRRDLINCFNNNGSSTYLTRLFTKYLDVTALLEMINLKDVINESSSRASLDTEKIIKNYADIVFQNCCCSKENLEFLEEINDFITNLSISQENFYSKEIIFRIVLYLEVITIATRHNRYEVEKLHHVVEKSLCIIDNIIINKNSANLKYKMTKILEAFINVSVYFLC